MSDIDTAVVDSLKALDLKRPIREADMGGAFLNSRHFCNAPLVLAVMSVEAHHRFGLEATSGSRDPAGELGRLGNKSDRAPQCRRACNGSRRE